MSASVNAESSVPSAGPAGDQRHSMLRAQTWVPASVSGPTSVRARNVRFAGSMSTLTGSTSTLGEVNQSFTDPGVADFGRRRRHREVLMYYRYLGMTDFGYHSNAHRNHYLQQRSRTAPELTRVSDSSR